MATDTLIIFGVASTFISAVYLRYERKRLQALLEEEPTICIYLAPQESDLLAIDVYSDESLARKKNAQWN